MTANTLFLGFSSTVGATAVVPLGTDGAVVLGDTRRGLGIWATQDSFVNWESQESGWSSRSAYWVNGNVTWIVEAQNGTSYYMANLDTHQLSPSAHFLDLTRWQVEASPDCQTTLQTVQPYYGRLSKTLIAGEISCRGEENARWVGLYDYQTEQFTEQPHQISAQERYQQSVSGDDWAGDVSIDDKGDIWIDDSAARVRRSYHSPPLFFHRAKVIPEPAGAYRLCAFASLNPSTYALVDAQLSRHFEVADVDTQWFTLLPEHLAIPDVSATTFNCISNGKGYLMSLSWHNGAVNQFVMLGGDLRPNWLMFPKKDSPFGLKISDFILQRETVQAAASFNETGHAYAGLAYFPAFPNVGDLPCGMEVSHAPVSVSLGLVERQEVGQRTPVNLTLERVTPLRFMLSTLSQLFNACENCYPTSPATQPLSQPPSETPVSPLPTMTHALTTLPSTLLPSGSPLTTAPASQQPTINETTALSAPPSGSPVTALVSQQATTSATANPSPDHPVDNRKYVLLLLLLLPPLAWKIYRKRKRPASEQQLTTAFVNTIQTKQGLDDFERFSSLSPGRLTSASSPAIL